MLNIARLENLLMASGFSVSEAGSRELVISCSLCSDHKERLYISKEHGRWFCFHCQAKGHLGQLLTEVCGLDEHVAQQMERRIKTRDAKPGFTPPPPERPFKLVEEVKPPPGYLPISSHWDLPVAQPYRDYLLSRGVSFELAQRHKMGYVLLGAYARRVILPVKTEGHMRTWQARVIDPNVEPKVLTCPDSHAGQAIFNLDFIEPPWVVLVEGVFDALKLPTLAAATLGARVSKWQRQYLKRQGFTHVVVMRDADEAGQQANAKDAMELMGAGFSVFIAPLPLGVHDPGSARPDQLEWALDNARPTTVSYSQELLKEVHQ